jgi:hypothetical protein
MVCGPEGQELYGETFRYLVGEPILECNLEIEWPVDSAQRKANRGR